MNVNFISTLVENVIPEPFNLVRPCHELDLGQVTDFVRPLQK